MLLKGTFVILFTQILSLIWPWPVQDDGHDLTCSIWGLWHLLTSSRRRPDLCKVLVSDAPPIQAPFINTRGTFKRKWKLINFITCTNGHTSQFKEYFQNDTYISLLLQYPFSTNIKVHHACHSGISITFVPYT